MQRNDGYDQTGAKRSISDNAVSRNASESAAAFNAKALLKGVTKVMKDSGISTKDTTRVSNKFNGVQSSTGIAEMRQNRRQNSEELSEEEWLRWNQS